MELIKNLRWRYATKKFDSTKKISNQHLHTLKEAIQLSVSSYGLQLYKVLIIENTETRKKLQAVSWNQSQITEASHLFVFCNYTEASSKDVETYIQQTATVRQIPLENLTAYKNFMVLKLSEKTAVEKTNWLKSQTYLALGNLLTACAELKIDACPMEGFEAESYNKILNLNKQGLSASVIATVGYRHPEDTSQNAPKIRKTMAQLFKII